MTSADLSGKSKSLLLFILVSTTEAKPWLYYFFSSVIEKTKYWFIISKTFADSLVIIIFSRRKLLSFSLQSHKMKSMTWKTTGFSSWSLCSGSEIVMTDMRGPQSNEWFDRYLINNWKSICTVSRSFEIPHH